MTWCDALLLASQSSGFGARLMEALEVGKSRPVSVERCPAVGRRVIQGWRFTSINEALDACVSIDGDVWIRKVERISVDGRLYRGHTRENGAHLLWRQSNIDAARENSRKQAAKARARMRVQWAEYCAAYRARFPDSVPVGFDRWSRTLRFTWLESGVDGLRVNDAKGVCYEGAL